MLSRQRSSKEIYMNPVVTVFRLLTFRTTREEFGRLDMGHLAVGLTGTWMVGVGRYWDDPGAKLIQHLGLGSVIYVFCLAAIIWLIVKPFFVQEWSYYTVLIFITMTSFPGIIYAIPVERFLDIDTAASINVWFLAVVALWRLALLYFFLIRFTRLPFIYITIATLLPVCLIIVTLTYLNLERAVFQIMGGIREKTSNDAAYAILNLLSVLSVLLAGPLLLSYAVAIVTRWRAWKSDLKSKI
jgi:hypothetical protein